MFDFSFFHGLQQKLTWLFRPPKPPTPTSRRPETRFNSPRDGRKQGGVRGVVGGSRTESTEVGGFGVGKSWCEMEQGWHLRWRFCANRVGWWILGGWWLWRGSQMRTRMYGFRCFFFLGVGFYVEYWTCGSMLEEMMASGPFGFKEIVEETAFLSFLFWDWCIFVVKFLPVLVDQQSGKTPVSQHAGEHQFIGWRSWIHWPLFESFESAMSASCRHEVACKLYIKLVDTFI